MKHKTLACSYVTQAKTRRDSQGFDNVLHMFFSTVMSLTLDRPTLSDTPYQARGIEHGEGFAMNCSSTREDFGFEEFFH
jgi:hypothetical protein